jgi:two-component system sensor histidine kinase RpfC
LAENDKILLLGLLGFFMLAIGIFVAIWIWPAPNVPRRVLGMLADVGAITFALFLAGESGVGLVGIYLFSIFGNGFRYGRKSLFVSQVLCLAGFEMVILTAPWWREHPYIGSGLLCSILVLPLYVSTLLMRIWEARARTEQALKECLARERAGVP